MKNLKTAAANANEHGFLTQEQVMELTSREMKKCQYVVDPERSYPVYTHEFEIAVMSYKFFQDKGEMVMMYMDNPDNQFGDYYTDYDEETGEQKVLFENFSDEEKNIWNEVINNKKH